MKKILALVVALMMIMSMSVAMAASITVTQSTTTGTAGTESYAAYKIFDATKTDSVTDPVTTDDTLGPGTEEGFAYFVDAESPWLAVLQKSGQNWVELTASADGSQYSVKWTAANTEAAAIEFADWLLANKGEIAADYTFETGETKTVADGYYLITSSLGTNLILATSDISITEKNEYITDEKTAEESNYNVGEDVPYTITVTIPDSVDETKKATVHDTLPTEFDFNDDVAATVDGAAFTAFEVKQGTDVTDDCTFEIEITLTGMAGKSIEFTYSAEVTNRAVSDTGYINTEFTSYSDYTTTPKTVEVKTYDFDLEKTDGDGEPLEGAVFELRETADGAAIEFIEVDGGYERADSQAKTKVTELEAGSINIGGLAAATYYLVELEAPDGYNKLAGPVIVVIDEDGNVTLDGESDSQGSLDESKISVENNAGSVLPSTGGIGTTIFYIAGTVLVLAAVVLLVTKRRMGADK